MDSEYDHFSLNSYLNHDSGGNAYLPLYTQTIPFSCSDVEDLDFLGFFLVRCIRGLVKPWLCVTTERASSQVWAFDWVKRPHRASHAKQKSGQHTGLSKRHAYFNTVKFPLTIEAEHVNRPTRRQLKQNGVARDFGCPSIH
jgi:hypothetical protein